MSSPGPEWKRNPGRLPDEAKGKRVVVMLANGSVCGETPVSKETKAGWAADGKGGCRWSLTNDPFDIHWYRVL